MDGFTEQSNQIDWRYILENESTQIWLKFSETSFSGWMHVFFTQPNKRQVVIVVLSKFLSVITIDKTDPYYELIVIKIPEGWFNDHKYKGKDKLSGCETIEMPMIWDVIALIMLSL